MARGPHHAGRDHGGERLHLHRALPPRLAMLVGRFFSVGLLCALLHNAIMIGGDWLGLHYLASSFVSFAIVVLLRHWLHSSSTFPGAPRGGGSSPRDTPPPAL